MSTTSETGHHKNVANFEDLLTICKGYGATYKPAKASIKIAALELVFTKAQNALDDVNLKLTHVNRVTNTRQSSFTDLRKLSTQLVNALAASDVSLETVEDAKSINRKVQGARASAKKTTTAPADSETPPVDTSISVSRRSYDSLTEHFSKLITLLANEPNFQPNETNLQVESLTALLNEMKANNTAVLEAEVLLKNSRIERNNILYSNTDSVFHLSKEIKMYVKSVFGANSPQTKHVNSIKITSIRR